MALRRPRCAEARLGAVRRAGDAHRRRRARRSKKSGCRATTTCSCAAFSWRSAQARRRASSRSTPRRFTAASSSKSASPEGAEFELFGANIGTGLSTNEIVTNVKHLGAGGRSRQAIRSVLNGKAVGSYLGKVEVARGAQQTDAEQSVKAMLLDRGATANCKPELEIFADDVKCAHGATVGELDAMQLFYAESRGLDPASARALLLEGFVMGLWDSAQGAGRDLRSRARCACGGSCERAHPHQLRARTSATSSRRSTAGIISTAPRPRRSRRR